MSDNSFVTREQLSAFISDVLAFTKHQRIRYWLMILITFGFFMIGSIPCDSQMHIVFGRDISVSALQETSGIPRLVPADYKPLVQEVKDEEEGIIAVGSIGATSRNSWARFELFNTTLIEPTQGRGESSGEFLNRWLAWDDEQKAGNSRRQNVDIDAKLKKFEADAKRHYDYSKQEFKSDVLGFLDLAVQLLNEPHRTGKKYIIMGTDGVHAFEETPFVPLPKDITLIVVNSRRNIGDLKWYKHVVFTSYEGAVNYIVNH